MQVDQGIVGCLSLTIRDCRVECIRSSAARRFVLLRPPRGLSSAAGIAVETRRRPPCVGFLRISRDGPDCKGDKVRLS